MYRARGYRPTYRDGSQPSAFGLVVMALFGLTAGVALYLYVVRPYQQSRLTAATQPAIEAEATPASSAEALSPKTPTAPPAPDRLGELLANVAARRASALRAAEFMQGFVDDRDALRILQATTQPVVHPADPSAGAIAPELANRDPVADLLLVLCQRPRPVLLEPLLEFFPQYKLPAQRWQALLLLSMMPQSEAGSAWVQLASEMERVNPASLCPLPYDPSFDDDVLMAAFAHRMDEIVPALIRLSGRSACVAYQAYPVIAALYDTHEPARETIRELAPMLLKQYAVHRDALEPAQKPGSDRWMYEVAYVEHRFSAATMLADVFSRLDTPEVRAELDRAVARYVDPVLLLGVVSARLWHQMPVDDGLIERLSRFAEVRVELWQQLTRLGLQARYPAAARTQQSLAEGMMVATICARQAGARPPTDITHAGTVRTEDGLFHVFRFRIASKPASDAPAGDWLAGISGPWPIDGSGPWDAQHSGAEFGEETWTDFRSFGRRDPAGHVSDLRESFTNQGLP